MNNRVSAIWKLFPEHSTYSYVLFIQHVAEKILYALECNQTENGFKFTNRLNAWGIDRQTFSKKALANLGIQHKLIRPFTPWHNCKSERSYRKDIEDFRKQLAVSRRQYNKFPMRPLNWCSPEQALL